MSKIEYATNRHNHFQQVTVSSDYENLSKTASVKAGAKGRIVGEHWGSVLILFERESAHLVVSNHVGQCAVEVPKLKCDIDYSSI